MGCSEVPVRQSGAREEATSPTRAQI